MAAIEILGSGRLDERESAFPQAVQLPDGDLVCSFSVGGGQYAEGGTDWARSRDGGLTWELEGTILAPTGSPPTTNFLKLSLARDGKTIYAYGARTPPDTGNRFGEKKCEAIFCRSEDDGRSWSAPQVIPMPVDYPLEISHGILPLSSGRLLAPAAVRAPSRPAAAVIPERRKTSRRVGLVLADDLDELTIEPPEATGVALWSLWGMHLTPEAPRSSIRTLEDHSRTLGEFQERFAFRFQIQPLPSPRGAQ